ncbi:M4 family metallopeptidase [soil metagenome]
MSVGAPFSPEEKKGIVVEHCCSIIPNDVLRRLSEDDSLPAEVRGALADAARLDAQLRKFREEARKLTVVSNAMAPVAFAVAPAPVVAVDDCRHGQALPGVPVANPANSTDPTARRAFDETSGVAEFYHRVFDRHSIDGAGMTLRSSIHYGEKYNNAFWNGMRMAYGDGDGEIFVDFTGGNDVVCHELAHGVTQHSLQLVYRDEAGGLNESLSDVFGSMYRQWRAQQAVGQADWLIGSDIIGPLARAKGITCLRDLADPAGAHCLAPQPTHYSQITPGMDPHYSSGIPNVAFHKAAMAIGGNSWLTAGQVWYHAMVGLGSKPNLRMKAFADATRQTAARIFPGDPSIAGTIDAAWVQVGL